MKRVRFKDYLKDYSFVMTDIRNIFKNSINLVNMNINKGYSYDDLFVISENDILQSDNRRINYRKKFYK